MDHLENPGRVDPPGLGAWDGCGAGLPPAGRGRAAAGSDRSGGPGGLRGPPVLGRVSGGAAGSLLLLRSSTRLAAAQLPAGVLGGPGPGPRDVGRRRPPAAVGPPARAGHGASRGAGGCHDPDRP